MIVQYIWRWLLATPVMSLLREEQTLDMVGIEISQVIRPELEVE
jgi:hypothetical protein